MQVEANGRRLWFDVDGPALVPDGRQMRERPTVVLVHGGPGSYDHSYFKPDFARLGRSQWGEPAEWSFEVCADDIRGFCDALGISRPVVYGHSMGGPIVLLYGARHPGHAAGLVVQSGYARFDVPRLVEGFRRLGGDEVAELARRSFSGNPVSDEDRGRPPARAREWARVFAAFGPQVPNDHERARRRMNLDLGPHGMELSRRLDIVDQLGRIECPTLVCVGALDPVTPVAAAREIVQALPDEIARLEVMEGAGHFTWKDVPDRYWPLLVEFVMTAAEA